MKDYIDLAPRRTGRRGGGPRRLERCPSTLSAGAHADDYLQHALPESVPAPARNLRRTTPSPPARDRPGRIPGRGPCSLVSLEEPALRPILSVRPGPTRGGAARHPHPPPPLCDASQSRNEPGATGHGIGGEERVRLSARRRIRARRDRCPLSLSGWRGGGAVGPPVRQRWDLLLVGR